jgi:Ca2+-binding RTX toxin-like protein
MMFRRSNSSQTSSQKNAVRHAFFTRRPMMETLERREVLSGFQTLEPAYVVPVAPSVEITPLLTVGDTVSDNYAANNGGGVSAPYRMVGIPDGLGAFDNGNGTFTVLMNHELGSTSGIVRDHGSKGAFVSRWVIDKSSLQVLEGDDLIKQVYVWNSTLNAGAGGYEAATTAFNRLCSADLPDATAFYNRASGKGTTTRIFMNGEETSSGRAFAHIASGPNAGQSWELPWTGKYAWENHVASPYAQDKTIVMGLDDSRREFSSEGSAEPSEVYVWVGNKQATGNEIEKAGLTRLNSANQVVGVLHGLRVGLPGNYDANESTVASGERFELVPLSDQTNNPTFAALETESIANTVTQFRRVEDGHFDPTNPDVFYYVTTDIFGGSTRLWKLTFDDITHPEAGGIIEIAVDSPAGVDGEMFDNITANYNGDVLLQEDPGGNPYLAKIWQWDASDDDLIEVAQHNPALFGAPGIDLYPNIPGVQATQDEESSGIIDLSHILGEGYYLADVQAHYSFTSTTDPSGELVQGGQLFIMNTNAASAQVEDGVLVVEGTINDDKIIVEKHGNNFNVLVNGESIGEFRRKDVESIQINGNDGDDFIDLSNNITIYSIVFGGTGSDIIFGSNGSNELHGDEGDDAIFGGNGADLLFGDAGNDILFGGNGADALFGGTGNDFLFGGNGADLLDGGDDEDWLFGGNGADLLLSGEHNFQ